MLVHASSVGSPRPLLSLRSLAVTIAFAFVTTACGKAMVTPDPTVCSAEVPDGTCPPGMICVEGTCEIDCDATCGGECPPCAAGSACVAAEDCESGVCTGEVCQVATCTDTVHNGDETDVDCGGSSCDPCPASSDCAGPDDCDSGVCTGDVCQAPSCGDTVQNGDESDVDCGGSCPPCADGSDCTIDGDCVSGVCTGDACQVPTCSDNTHNGGESDIDCGGGCPACADGSDCVLDVDCASEVCDSDICQAPTCSDRAENGGETDLNCGGPTCPPCADDASCQLPSDCASGVCDPTLLTCTPPACDDGVHNGSEGDVDCGESCAVPCADGASCGVAADCDSNFCPDGTCRPAECNDSSLNGQETDVDCGGPVCPACAVGDDCLAARDCVTGVCIALQCEAAACDDGVQNQDETDVDCGGDTCPGCGTGEACTDVDDCASGSCVDSVCRPASCDNDTLDSGETDVDCGGPDCAPCAPGDDCQLATDCDSGICTGQTCAEPACDDGVHNGDESDQDCGGSCPDCATGQGCSTGWDCDSGVCDPATDTCAAPTCTDRVHNGTETDVDCGGPCDDCPDGSGCQDDGDCDSGVCTGDVCQAPTCTDTVENGDETDVDCGGDTCDGCAEGLHCGDSDDCAAGLLCISNQCSSSSCSDGAKAPNETDIDCGGVCPPCGDGLACLDDDDCQSGVCDDSALTCSEPTCSDATQNQGEAGVDCGAVCPGQGCPDGNPCTVDDDCASLVCSGDVCQVPACDDGVKNGSEACDGTNLDGQGCGDHGFVSGVLACLSDCSDYDTSGCYTCNNNIKEGPELCDTDQVDENCIDVGFDGGVLGCNDTCDGYDRSLCHRCNNGVLELTELCDTTEVGDADCADYGFTGGGQLLCNSTCDGHVLTSCIGGCGNAEREATYGEACDDTDFDGDTCAAHSFSAGELLCAADCSEVFYTACTGGCGNDLMEGSEACDGTDFGGLSTCDELPRTPPFAFDGGPLRCTACALDLSLCVGGCGNDLHEAGEGEVCDGSDHAGEACNTLGFVGGDLSCAADCSAFDLTACVNGCGNGVRESLESCDGADLGGLDTCDELGAGEPTFTGGTLGCRLDCTWDFGACTGGCGNGVLEAGEECDLGDFGAGVSTCDQLAGYSFGGGTPQCNIDCTLDLSACTDGCGNGIIDGSPAELCDGGAVASDCATEGFADGGVLTCNSTCDGYDYSGCFGGCGNRIIEPAYGEVCDLDVNSATCESLLFASGTIGCASDCQSYDLTACVDGCGNGLQEGGEDCDGSDLQTLDTCDDLASPTFAGGPLACTEGCTWDLSSCVDGCGNEVIDSGEDCDGGNLGGLSACSDLGDPPGFTSGALSCADDCTWDQSDCGGGCGNGLIEGGEVCDPPAYAGRTCESFGFGGGALDCAGDCTAFDFSGCTDGCGNGVVEAGLGEDCDGANLGGLTTCDQLGSPAFTGGDLACSACAWDLSGCTGGCGNDTREGSEACDGTDLDSQTCVLQGFAGGGTLACLGDCTDFDTFACADGCGNGRIEQGEECDGATLPFGADCSDYGFSGGGNLACIDCTVDVSGCVTGCGNDTIDAGEDCDGADLDGLTACSELGDPPGFTAGDLACNLDCTWDLAACTGGCGNGVQESGEDCDDSDLNGASCATVSPFERGTLACASDCTFDTSECTWCGDGAIRDAEVCDGANVPSDCIDLGFTGGTIACASDCLSFDVSQCTQCGNGVQEGTEQCDNQDLDGQSCASVWPALYDSGILLCDGGCEFDDSACTNCADDCTMPGAACIEGVCRCPTLATMCDLGGGDVRCIDTRTDPALCGNCAETCTPGVPCDCSLCTTACAGGETCAGGSCDTGWLSPTSQCGTECVDLATDNENCGTCGNDCTLTGRACDNGGCAIPLVPLVEPERCEGGGPPIDPGVGALDCTGELAEITFRWGVCACENITFSTALYVDAFDSSVAAYDPANPLSAGGIAANTGIVQTGSNADIYGTLWSGDILHMAGLYVDLYVRAYGTFDMNGGTLASNAYFDNDVIATSGTVEGDVYQVEGHSTGGLTLNGSYNVVPATDPNLPLAPPPCDCTPSQLLDIPAIIWAHSSANPSGFNHNADIGLDPDVIANSAGGRLDLPCGHYYLSSGTPSGNGLVTIVAHGNAALYIDGNFDASKFNISIDPDAQLDIFVAGYFCGSAQSNFGHPYYPAQLRAYVGGSGECKGDEGVGFGIQANAFFGGNVYCPWGTFIFDANADVYGAVFARTFDVKNTTFHFDTGVTQMADYCPGPCGNGVLDDGEVCDGALLGGETCVTQGYDGGTLACNDTCDGFDTSGCWECGDGVINGPEACEPGALPGDPSDDIFPGDRLCSSRSLGSGQVRCTLDCREDTSACHLCGNGVIEATEQCDGGALDGETCETLGWGTGELTCVNCLFDGTNCLSCGDGAVNLPGEQCDLDDLDGQSCATLGFTAGTLACLPGCQFDTSDCSVCGDGIRDPATEACDGNAIGGVTCQDFGEDGGTVTCNETCDDFILDCYRCGDGIINGFEDCDGSVPGGIDCTNLGYDSGPLSCVDCVLDTSQCVTTSVCGDGSLVPPEECEGTNLGGATCQSLGYDDGVLVCDTDACLLDPSGCTVCGNGIWEFPYEECDGLQLGGRECHHLPGFDGGTLSCSADCTYDTSGCFGCGNGVIDGTEECDGSDFGGLTCASFGYSGGSLTCVGCAIDTSGCYWCGNSTVDPGEQCDGTDFGGEDCTTLVDDGFPAYTGGDLDCFGNCTFDPSDCYICGNGIIEAAEDCEGTNLQGATCRSLGFDAGVLGCVDCQYDTSGCSVCGNTTLEGDEECDPPGGPSTDPTCDSLAGYTFSGGDLYCGPACLWDVSGCFGCGNGILEPGEECDGTELGGANCNSLLGSGTGVLTCAPDCTFDTSACYWCGDDVINGFEECDEGAVAGNDADDVVAITCIDLGYDGGDLYCLDDCTYDTTRCTGGEAVCGDGTIEPPEECEPPSDFGGVTCVTLGYEGGTLACVSCQIDPSCYWCGDGVTNGSEVCDGGDVGGLDCTDFGYAGGTLGCLPDCSGYDLSGCIECYSCRDCGRQACACPPGQPDCPWHWDGGIKTLDDGGECGACIDDSDCCSPLICHDGNCVDQG